MDNILIINGGQKFAHSGGIFNKTLSEWSADYFRAMGYAVLIVDINKEFDAFDEVEKFKWADLVLYNIPIWWFQVPNLLKKYIDEVFTAGHNNGIYKSDGRSRSNPEINYGTGGLMQGKRYMVNTTWNAPDTAFTLSGEFFEQKTVDDGILFGFHKMNAFTGMQRIQGFHFHDMEKNVTEERISDYKEQYLKHIAFQFPPITHLKTQQVSPK